MRVEADQAISGRPGTATLEPVEAGIAAPEPLGRLPTALETPRRRPPSPSRISRCRALRDTVSAKPFVGHYLRALPAREQHRDLAWDAMLRALALRRGPQPDPSEAGPAAELGLSLADVPLLRKLRHRRPGRLLLFVVDISGSMGGTLMELARRLALAALLDAYVERDRVAMVAFRAHSAELLFGPTNQVERVHRTLRRLPLGGTTPLAAGLGLGAELLRRAAGRDPSEQQTLVLISDGKPTVGSRPGHEAVLAEVALTASALRRRAGLAVVFLDTTERGKHDWAARRLTAQLGATRIRIGELPSLHGEAARAAVAMLLTP